MFILFFYSQYKYKYKSKTKINFSTRKKMYLGPIVNVFGVNIEFYLACEGSILRCLYNNKISKGKLSLYRNLVEWTR